MTRSSLGRLKRCWRSQPLFSPLRTTACHIHTQQQHHKTNANPLSQQHRRTPLSTSQCRYSTHIVKSPFKDIDIPNKLITEKIWETVDRFPESTAIKCGLTGRAYTFADIQRSSYRFANSMRKAGFKKGEIIALVLPNCPEYAIITLGALEAELSMSFVNHAYTADEICHQLLDSGSVCVVAALGSLKTVFSAVTKLEEKTKSKPIRRIIAVDIPSPESLPSGVVRFSEMMTDNVDSTPIGSKTVLPTDLAFLPYSSGTTGLPKGVCLSQRNVIANILQFSTVNGLDIKSPEENQDILLGLLPFYHIYGLVVILLTSLARGGQIITLPKFDQDSLINIFENEKMTILMLVPPLILFLGHSNRVLPKHLAHVRLVTSGAAPLGATDMERLAVKLPPEDKCIRLQAYGMTETSPVAILPPLPVKDLDTIGMPVPSTFAKVINPATGESLGPFEPGELCIKGPQVMMGYHNNPKATADTIDSEGWLRTGDVASYEEDGHFYIKDRLKELIKVKGFQVAPAELEEVLRTNPCINDAGVIGVACPRGGETPVAYVVPMKGKKLTVDDVKNFLSEKVSEYKQVSNVLFVDSIPKSASGKILRKDLKEMYVKDHQLS